MRRVLIAIGVHVDPTAQQSNAEVAAFPANRRAHASRARSPPTTASVAEINITNTILTKSEARRAQARLRCNSSLKIEEKAITKTKPTRDADGSMHSVPGHKMYRGAPFPMIFYLPTKILTHRRSTSKTNDAPAKKVGGNGWGEMKHRVSL